MGEKAEGSCTAFRRVGMAVERKSATQGVGRRLLSDGMGKSAASGGAEEGLRG